MRIRKTASGITAAIMLATAVCSPLCDNLPLTSGGVAVVAGAEKVNSASAQKSVTDYSYTVTPLLEPFNEYFFVKTDNPDPCSFRFIDKSSIYGDSGNISPNRDYRNDGPYLYEDIKYENIQTGRVDGGYIFRGSYTDGGEVELQSNVSTYYSSTWEDTGVKLRLPTLKDDVDYLIDTYATKSDFFDNMDAVESGFSSICLYSGSYIRGELYKVGDYWGMSTSPHKDQLFYIQSPYKRKNSKPLFASTAYPYRYDSLGFPSVMSTVAKRLDNTAEVSWNEDYHYLVDVTYNGETRSYGGAGTGEGQGISNDKIKQYFTFTNSSAKLTTDSLRELLKYYASIKMEDDVPREDALTWKSIYDTVGEGSWVRLITITGIFGGSGIGYSYLYKDGDGDYFSTQSAGNAGGEIYWGGDLGYASDVWVDGRYVDAYENFVPGEKFENHPTSSIFIKTDLPLVKYKTEYKYNYDTGKYVPYSTVTSVEIKKNNVLFNYSSDDNIWMASYGSFENGYAYYDKIKEFVEKGQLDKKYLDMVTLTPDEVKALKVDRNTDAVPDKYFVYDMTEEPGTSSEKHIHSFTSTVVKPTETAQGYTLHTCTKCGYSYKDNYTPALKPTELTGVKVKTHGTASLTLAWDKNANAKGYIIEQYKGGKWTQIAKTSSNATVTYTVNGLAADTTYTFRIKAYAISGESEIYSDYVKIAGKTRIPNVAKFTGSTISDSAVKLDWSKNDKATGYVIEQYKGGKWTALATTKNNTTLTFTVKGLADDTAYSFRIKSYRMVNGVTDFSEYTSVKAKTLLGNVKTFTAAATGTTAIKLDWSKNDKATGYVIEQYKGGKWTVLATTKNNTTLAFTVKGLAEGTAYSFRIKSFRKTESATEFSEYTAIKAATLLDGVSDFKVASTTGSWITLEWAKNDKATGYSIEQYKGGKWTVIATTKNNTTLKFTVKGLKNDTTYSFRIRAYKTAGGSNVYSDYVRIAGKTRIPNVATFKGSAASASAVKLDWSKNDKATGYVIEQYKGGKWTVLATTKNNTTLTFTVKGLARGTTYSFRIKSFRKTGSTIEFSEYAAIKAATAK